MPTLQLEPQVLMGDMSRGVVTDVGYRIAPMNSVAHAVNVEFDRVIGEAKVRPGTARVGSAAVSGSNQIDGLFQFVDSEGGANSQLLAVSNGSVYIVSGGTWTESLSGDTAGSDAYFATFLDSVVRVNEDNAPKSFNGSAWISSGGAFDLDNMPQGKFVTVYKDQVVVAGVSGSPDDLRISSIPTSGAISWTSGNRTITVNPDDDGNITGLGQIAGLLVVFKDNGMFRWNNRATEPDRIIDVGCTSQRSVSSGGNLLFFFNRKGIWATQGGYPVLISRRVQKWIDGMDSSFYGSVAGHCDGTYYRCSIGDCTVDGTTYSNVVLRYTLMSKEWAVHSYATKPTCFATYRSGNDLLTVYGDSTSNVVELDSGTADFEGSAIDWEVESHDFDFGSRGRRKEIRDRIYGFGTELADAQLSVRTDGARELHPVGSLTGSVSEKKLRKAIGGHFFSFRVSGSSRTAQRFSGLELPTVSADSYAR